MGFSVDDSRDQRRGSESALPGDENGQQIVNNGNASTSYGHPVPGAFPGDDSPINGVSIIRHERQRSAADDKRRRSSEKGAERDDLQENNYNPRPSRSKTCGKCGEALGSQFVRALDGTFHLECFTCHDCGKIVASKFFPYPEKPPGQFPLCETDYFRRLDLLCFACGSALRGSYITALDRKYHIEHFTCSVCPTVFGNQDSYYEHDSNVYCHYHYSTRFAQKCNGCQTAILKQYVEIFRNGQNQHWHPECYMIHKYWNVRLQTPGVTIENIARADGEATEEDRQRVKVAEEKVEEKVLYIWRTLSAYEEKSATCISDMLLHVSNGAYMDGVIAAKKFILHVDLLFTAADNLDQMMSARLGKGLSYSREAKLLCKKVVAFFQVLSESQDKGVRRLGVTQELLSLVTGLAHYLKLLIRICLQGSLKLERQIGNDDGLYNFLEEINNLETKVEGNDSKDWNPDIAELVQSSADTCPVCSKPVEDRCLQRGSEVYHQACMKCTKCQRDLSSDPSSVRWLPHDQVVLCAPCAGDTPGALAGFESVTRLQQYVHLLQVAHARLLATLRTSGALPHTSDDPNLDKYDSQSGRDPRPPILRQDNRSKSFTGQSSQNEAPETSYEQTLGDIRRMRSRREDKHLSSALKSARMSRLIDESSGPVTGQGLAGESGHSAQQHSFRVVQDRSVEDPMSQLRWSTQEAIRLDDIPRLMAAEQAREQRPNASKYSRGGLSHHEPKAKLYSGHRRDTSGGYDLDQLGPEGQRPKKYFSELSPIEYFIVRHVAVLSMEPLLEGVFNQEELLELIESRKPTFWGKFGIGKAFSKNEKSKAGRKKGVFGVALDTLIEKDGAESTDGVGPGALRIPAVIQDAISAMRTMDMSMEGVFRKNGNMKRLKETAEIMDSKGGDAVDLNTENPVQVAALLKKFLRDLPDPVMTHKLHKLWIASQRIQDEDKRRRILHLTCCLLPKSHRDTLEIVFCFLAWAASFSVVDEESGSKMDIHNLATVIAPNILRPAPNGPTKSRGEEMEESFLGIEAVNTLIESNEAMCEVPEDLQSILNDSSLFSGSADITTKEILKRYGDIARQNPTSVPMATSTSQPGYPIPALPASATFGRESPAPPPVNGDYAYPEQQSKPGPSSAFFGNSSAAGSRDSIGINGSPSRFGRGMGVT